jgi:DNA helicase-2/ATP-dependent DNA helicase PcrA
MSQEKSNSLYPAYLSAADELRGNPDQWAAYESQGNCVMLAGPGSGKTKTLTIKLARLLNEDVRFPRGVACITYSAECARELKKRLIKLGIEESNRVFIGTVHGFCLKHIITPFAHLAGIELAYPLVIPDKQKWDEIFERVALDMGIQEEPYYLKLRMDRYRRTLLDRSDPEWLRRDEQTARLIENFEERLHSFGYIDFEDMVLIGHRLIKENAWIRRALQAKFPVLVVDEYQDLGNPLHQIVLSLCFEAGVRIIAVGDPDQSIFGFTGANPELLRELASKDSIEAISLKMNYRSGKTIVASSMVALDEEREYIAAGMHEGIITFWECPDGIKSQAEIICSKIIPQALTQKEGRTLGDIAILYIDKNDAAIITYEVKSRGIKYVGGDKEIRYAVTPLTRWLEDCAAWCGGGWQTGAPSFSSLIDFWCYFNEASPGSRFQKDLRQSLVKFLWDNRNPEILIKDWLEKARIIGLHDSVDLIHVRSDEKDSFKSLLSAANDLEKLGTMTIGGFGKLRGSSDHLNLVTLHSSKGLEFDVVIMMGLEQGRIPPYSATTPDSKREPRRLFYVGITRARDEVHLVYSGFYKNKYGRVFVNGPSEFVIEVQQSLNN